MSAEITTAAFEKFLGQIPEITIALDSQGVTSWCNSHATERLGLVVGIPIDTFLDPGSLNKLASSLFQVREGSDLVTELVFVVENRPVLCSVHIFRYDNAIIVMAREEDDDESRFEQLSALLAEFANLQRETSKQQSELQQHGYLLTALSRELETERRRLVSLIDQLPEGIVIVNDTSGEIQMTNLRIQELWNLAKAPECIEELPIWSTDFEPVSSADLPLYRSMVSRVDEGPDDYIIQFEKLDVKPIFVQVTASPVLNELQEVVGSAMSIVDVTEHVQLQDSLERQALLDPLTGLGNRRSFADNVEHAIGDSKSRNAFLTILYIDLDGFKAINDNLGHDTGDMAIVEAGARIRSAVRDTDAVARIGGDEFAVLLYPTTNLSQVEQVVRRILDSLNEPMEVAGQAIRLPGSVGVSVLDGDEAITTSEAIRRADIAMYEAKAAGTSRWAYFHDSHRPDGRAPRSLIEEIRHALDTEQFEMLYRPVVDLRIGNVREVEIAMFWRTATEGLLDDHEIRSRAWRAGVLHEIAEHAAELGERDRPLMLEAIGNRTGIVLSRHYWIEYLREDRVIDQLAQIARDVRGTPITVWIELSGRILPGDDATLNRLIRLYEEGIQFSIAEFGGYEGDTGLLRHLPVEAIVASADLVNSALTDRRAHTLLRSVVATAQVFDLPAKAPGIRTAEELRMIRDLGFDFGSGPLFSRPLTAGELLDFSIDHVFDLDK